jgi:hypothetical protein
MKNRSVIKPLLYTLGSIALVLVLAIWVFNTFYFESTLNRVVIPKIELAAAKATHGRFALTLDKIYYRHGTLICNTFVLYRVAYDSGEHGMVLEKVTLDTARFEGISWWDALWQKNISMKSLDLKAPKLYMIDIDTGIALPRIPKYVPIKNVAPSNVPILSFDSIVLRNAIVFLPKLAGKSSEPTYKDITIKLTDFSLDPKSMLGEPTLFSQRVDFNLPGGSYSMSDSMYSLNIRGIRGSFSDSLVTIDSITYEPNYSEEAFADKYKYVQGRLQFQCSGIVMSGINFTKLLSGGGFSARSCKASSWFVDYYGDLRKPVNPHPPDALLPHTILSSIKAPITLDSIVFNNGTIHHRERITGSTHASLLTFTQARVSASPFCTTPLSPLYREPLRISVKALFMGQGQVIGTILYPIHQKPFDLHVVASVGPFDARVLNSYLISNERKQVMNGKILGGEIRMDVRSGVGITTVGPRYSDLSMEIMSTDVKKSRGILEGIKTFFANTFVLRTNNLDNGDVKAVSATTTTIRTSKQEFFEFLWIAMRKSILKVLGF